MGEQRQGGHRVRDRRAQQREQRHRHADQQDQQKRGGTEARQYVSGRPAGPWRRPALARNRPGHQHATPRVMPNSAQAVSCAFMVKPPKNALMSGVVVTET